MSDKESDGPQKSFVGSSNNPNSLKQAYHEGDQVQMKTGPNGKPEDYEVHNVQWNGKGWEYQVKRKGEREVYSEMHGNKRVDWFEEDKLEAAG